MRARKFISPFGIALAVAIAWQVDQPQHVIAQDILPGETEAPPNDADGQVEVAAKVEVSPATSDGPIAARLYDIMFATGWFQNHDVDVDEGVVFLSGNTNLIAHSEWAEQTAMRTKDVVAVVNRIEINPKPLWDLSPAQASLKSMLRNFVASVPLIAVALAVIALFYLFAKIAATITRRIFNPESDSKLLRQVVATVVGVVVFLIGLHIALRISGLTRLATTLLGGTGLIGLAIGFAFRDIAENFLSSILLSLNHPFRVGDLIEVDGTTGYVRRVTTRATILATFEGNQVQIPNSTIYKGKITNFTASPLRRRDFAVGIGFDDSAQQAQTLIMEVLQNHEAVEKDPEPTVLVESLGSATVNLKCFYWFNQKKNSGGKVNSVLIRRVKQTLNDNGISMPDEARELVFPADVPVRMIEPDSHTTDVATITKVKASEPELSSGEGDLASEEQDVQTAVSAEETEEGENILED
ncbi:mechanosensitive ion channel family protein [Planctomycetes bacterium K23_9]|uniref:Small-conductance mechanosensitive channel n=1 Tax=Stieleria marina TaxID=1930275 RepID=A0A517P3D7_9BACT|nr:Small-conductance mechanosensitive channel [Planctomycetes bacterium K23_9]